MAVLGATSLTGCNSIPSFIAGGSLMLFQQTSAPTSWTKITTHNNKALRVVNGSAGSGGSTAFTSIFTSRAVSGSIAQFSAPIAQATAGGTIATANVAVNQGNVGTNATAAGGSVGNHTLATNRIPSHTHSTIISTQVAPTPISTADMPPRGFGSAPGSTSRPGNNPTGGGAVHAHPFSGSPHSHSTPAHNHATPVHNHGFTGTQHAHASPGHNHGFTGTAQDFAVLYVDVIFASKN
jgi:hypothetical protein